MNNKFTELMVDANNPYLLLGVITISILVAAAFYFFLKSNTFNVGSQYNTIIKKMSRGKKGKNSKKMASDAMKESRLEAKRQQKLEKNVQLSRLRWNMNIDEYNSLSSKNMLQGLLIGFALVGCGLALPGKLQVAFILAGIGAFIIMPMSLPFKYSTDTAQLKGDVLKDLARMVSLYRYSDTSRGFYGLVQDYMPTANALKKDLEVYMADLNSYGEDEALDRLGVRVNSKEMFKLITYIKSSATATRSEFEANLNILDREMTELLQEAYKKESKRRFAVALFLVIPIFAAVMLIYIAPQLVDVVNTLTQSY